VPFINGRIGAMEKFLRGIQINKLKMGTKISVVARCSKIKNPNDKKRRTDFSVRLIRNSKFQYR